MQSDDEAGEEVKKFQFRDSGTGNIDIRVTYDWYDEVY